MVVLALAEASPDATTAVTTATSPVTAVSLNLALVCRLLHHPFIWAFAHRVLQLQATGLVLTESCLTFSELTYNCLQCHQEGHVAAQCPSEA